MPVSGSLGIDTTVTERLGVQSCTLIYSAIILECTPPLAAIPMHTQPSRLLSIVLLVDGVLSLGFGLASWFAPHATFGSIVALKGAQDDALLMSALGALSLMYVLLGFICLVSTALPIAHRIHFALVLALGHLATELKGFNEIGRDWLIGNPWPDIVIHSAFVIAYLALAGAAWRGLARARS